SSHLRILISQLCKRINQLWRVSALQVLTRDLQRAFGIVPNGLIRDHQLNRALEAGAFTSIDNSIEDLTRRLQKIKRGIGIPRGQRGHELLTQLPDGRLVEHEIG